MNPPSSSVWSSHHEPVLPSSSSHHQSIASNSSTNNITNSSSHSHSRGGIDKTAEAELITRMVRILSSRGYGIECAMSAPALCDAYQELFGESITAQLSRARGIDISVFSSTKIIYMNLSDLSGIDHFFDRQTSTRMLFLADPDKPKKTFHDRIISLFRTNKELSSTDISMKYEARSATPLKRELDLLKVSLESYLDYLWKVRDEIEPTTKNLSKFTYKGLGQPAKPDDRFIIESEGDQVKSNPNPVRSVEHTTDNPSKKIVSNEPANNNSAKDVHDQSITSLNGMKSNGHFQPLAPPISLPNASKNTSQSNSSRTPSPSSASSTPLPATTTQTEMSVESNETPTPPQHNQNGWHNQETLDDLAAEQEIMQGEEDVEIEVPMAFSPVFSSASEEDEDDLNLFLPRVGEKRSFHVAQQDLDVGNGSNIRNGNHHGKTTKTTTTATHPSKPPPPPAAAAAAGRLNPQHKHLKQYLQRLEEKIVEWGNLDWSLVADREANCLQELDNSALLGSDAVRLFKSLRKLPDNKVHQQSILKGLKARLDIPSPKSKSFNNVEIMECFQELKSFPYSIIKDVLICLGVKVQEAISDTMNNAESFTESQYAKIIYSLKNVEHIDADITRTLRLINDRLGSVIQERTKDDVSSSGRDYTKLLSIARWIGKGVIKLMQGCSSADSLSVSNDILEPLYQIIYYLSLELKVLAEMEKTIAVDIDLVVYVLQILKGQKTEDIRLRALMFSTVRYAKGRTFSCDNKFYETLIGFIGSMDNFSSNYIEVRSFVDWLGELLHYIRTCEFAPKFDLDSATRAKKYSFAPCNLRFALRGFGSSSIEVMRFVLALAPWLEDYGAGGNAGIKNDLDNIGKSYRGLCRMREAVLLSRPEDLDIVFRFQRFIEKIMPISFRGFRLKDAFIYSLARAIGSLDERDSIYHFIIQELLWTLSKDPQVWTDISLPALAALLHGIGKNKTWIDSSAWLILHGIRTAVVKINIFPALLPHLNLVSTVLAVPGSVIPHVCVMLTSLEHSLIISSDVAQLIDLFLECILYFIKPPEASFHLSFDNVSFICKGLSGFVSALKDNVKIMMAIDRVLGDLLIGRVVLSYEQMVHLIQLDCINFYLHRLLREDAWAMHRNIFNLIENMVIQCRQLEMILPLLEVYPLLHPKRKGKLREKIVSQMHTILLEASPIREVLEGILIQANINREEMNASQESGEIYEENRLLDVIICNCNKYRLSVDFRISLLSAHLLYQTWSMESPIETIREIVIICITNILMHIDNENFAIEWRLCLTFCRTFQKRKFCDPVLLPVVSHLQDVVLKRSILHLETLFGSFMNQNLASQMRAPANDNAVTYSSALEHLLHENQSKLLVECILTCSHFGYDNFHSKTSSLQSVFDDFYLGVFQLPECLRYTNYSMRYISSLKVQWRSIEEYAFQYIENKLRMLDPTMQTWQTIINHGLVNGLPGSICIEIVPTALIIPEYFPWNEDVILLSKPRDDSNSNDNNINPNIWLLIDILPKNRTVNTMFAQMLSDASEVLNNLRVGYAVVLLDLIIEDGETLRSAEKIGIGAKSVIEKPLCARLHNALDHILKCWGLVC
eukprot:scaffold222_cov176-Ochromonas_danica.AAC.1